MSHHFEHWFTVERGRGGCMNLWALTSAQSVIFTKWESENQLDNPPGGLHIDHGTTSGIHWIAHRNDGKYELVAFYKLIEHTEPKPWHHCITRFFKMEKS